MILQFTHENNCEWFILFLPCCLQVVALLPGGFYILLTMFVDNEQQKKKNSFFLYLCIKCDYFFHYVFNMHAMSLRQLLIHGVSMLAVSNVLWNIHCIIQRWTETVTQGKFFHHHFLLLVLINIQFKYTHKIVKIVDLFMTQYINSFPKIEILLRFQDLQTWVTKRREGQRKVW